MTRDEAIKLAESKGYSAKPCVAENMMAVKIGKADDPNERMRYTADGQILVIVIVLAMLFMLIKICIKLNIF